MTVLPPDQGAGPAEDQIQSLKRPYDKAFRTNAVERAIAPGARLSAVADELGVGPSTLRRWVKAHEASATPTTTAPHDDPATEPDDTTQITQTTEPAEQVEPAEPAEPAEQVEAAESAQPTEPDQSTEPVADPAPSPPPSHTAYAHGSVRAGEEVHDPSDIIAALDSILEMFPAPGAPPSEAELASPGPGARRDAEPPEERIPLHAGDDIFPTLPRLLPAYRFPLILVTLLAAVAASVLVPADYSLRPAAQALHIVSLVVSFGAVLVIDWHGLLWLSGRRGLAESTRLAAATGPLIWLGLGGLIASGALLHPNLSSPLTVTKLVLVLAVAWNGAAMSEFRRRLAQLPRYAKPGDLPRRDWRLLLGATVISQIGWWGATLIGFMSSST
jgi:transposase-like protein